jgi:DNA-binding beta-propeller fold protein YncE
LPVLLKVILNTVLGCILLIGPAAASDFMVPVKSIAQITIDEDNEALNYPVALFFDPTLEEIYLINGGKARIVVYGPDFFPRISIGKGRGVITPRGGTVLPNGEVYICQVMTAKNPRPRLTILNGAFFVDREIFLDEIPDIKDFRPRNVAVNNDGIIYLAGDNYRGVIVLDDEGNFLRLLQPMDQIILRGAEAELPLGLEGGQEGAAEILTEDTEETIPEEEDFANIPEEFRPRSSEEEGFREVTGPVKINYVNIDSTGKLYLISAETGKIYVYGPDESFLFSFGTKGGSPGQQSNPRALVVDEETEVIYVVDYMRHTILAYNLAGEYIFEFGGRGFNPGWFNFPTDISINNRGQLIIADLFNKRAQVLEVEKKGISYYMDRSQPGSVDLTTEGQEDQPDVFLEELYQTIKEEEKEGEVISEEEGVGEEREEEDELIPEEEGVEEEREEEDEVIFEEEVIEEAPPGEPAPLGPFDEPLESPEEIQ